VQTVRSTCKGDVRTASQPPYPYHAGALPHLDLPAELETFRHDVQAFLRAELAPSRAEGHRDYRDLTGWDETFERALLARAGEAGILGVSLPTEYGGGGRPRSWQAIVGFEAAYHDAPLIDTAAVLVAPTVLEFGSAAQRDWLLPAAAGGSITACIAYTEANAGSDLANITTRADDDARGDCYVLHGEKVLVTGAHKADWCCTIARTDPESRGSRGLSMFLVDMHATGVTVERVPTANGWTLGTIRFDGVRVGSGALLGERDRGWRQLGAALLSERSGAAWLGWATRNVEVLVEHCRGRDDTLARDALADVVTRLFVGYRLSERVLAAQDAGGAPAVDAAMAKVWITELLQRIARVGDALLGADVLAAPGWFGQSPLARWFAYETVERLHPTLSVGANEIQRTTIAELGLGLPR
jgi:alkylation response protein AidB-like acyl-CoA dehydrogenase